MDFTCKIDSTHVRIFTSAKSSATNGVNMNDMDHGRDESALSGVNDALAALRVMVIDDQRTMRETMRRLLGRVGIHGVVAAHNVEDALKILQSNNGADPDLIICDLHMERMDGLDFCNRVRRDQRISSRHVPIIILTADKNTLVYDVAMQVGAVTVLVKPISANELVRQLQDAVGFSADLTQPATA